MERIATIEESTNFEQIREQLKDASEVEMNIGTRSFFLLNMSEFMKDVDEELENVLGAYWSNLRGQSNDQFAIHSVLVLWRAVREPLFSELSHDDQNILKWACLLHDIAKRGTPAVVGRDHLHGFRSAALALEIFMKLGILRLDEAQSTQWSHLQRLIEESV